MVIPKNYNELTVKQFQLCDDIIRNESDILERHIKLVACLSGKPIEWVEAHTPKQIAEWVKDLSFLSNPKVDKHIPKWVIANKRIYKPYNDASKLTAGQVLALKMFGEKSVGHSNLHNQLACVFGEVDWYGGIKKYDANKHERIAKDMLEAKMGDVYGVVFFYTDVLETLSPVLEIYLKQANETIAEIMPEILSWAKEQGLKDS
jgi:hypothetical protein